MEVTGVRSSCEASARNWRSRSSEARWWEKASSIWLSMAFSERPKRPTSLSGSSRSTRRERSPAAMASAVCPISSSGRSPTRTTP